MQYRHKNSNKSTHPSFYLLLLLLAYPSKSHCQDSLKQYCTFTMVISKKSNHKKEHWPLWSLFYLYVDGEKKFIPAPQEKEGKEYYQLSIQKGSKNISLYTMFEDVLLLHAAPLYKDSLLELEPILFQQYTIAATSILHQPLELGEEVKLFFPYQKKNNHPSVYFLYGEAIARDSIQITINRTKTHHQLAITMPLAKWRDFIEQAQEIHPKRKTQGVFVVERGKQVKKYFLKAALLRTFLRESRSARR